VAPFIALLMSAEEEDAWVPAEEDDWDGDPEDVEEDWEDAAVPTAAQLLGVATLDDLHALGGAPIQHLVDFDRLVELCYDGWSNADMAEELAVPLKVVEYRKKQLGLTWLHEHPWLPDCDTLHEWWRLNDSIRVGTLAGVLNVSASTLRRHMKHVGFSPSAAQDVSDDALLSAVRQIKARNTVSRVGRTYLDGCLRDEFGICATDTAFRNALFRVDPTGIVRRAKQAAKARRSYRVAGPRSLYHADAHEKIAKKYGFWIHLLLDGYSRFIIYLSVATNKKSDTVRLLYRGACEAVGWPSRCRWDKGSENVGARMEQLHYWKQRRSDWQERGSVLVGRSVQNCRAEYVWRPVHEHVSGVYAKRFDALAVGGLLDCDSPEDLHCLHAVFLRHVQEACNRFAGMWNHRRIRGERTIQGCGGGRPIELFTDPVGSTAVLDDERAMAQGQLYGEDTPFTAVGEPEETDMKVEELRTLDPLAELGLMQLVRAAYFEVHPLGEDDAGEHDYQRYKLVCHELLEAMAETYFDCETRVVDWAAFGASQGEYHLSCQLQLRWELSNVALQRGLEGWS